MSATGVPLVQLVNIWCSELIYQIVVPIVQRNYSERIQCQGNACSVLAFSSSNDQNNRTWDIISYLNLL